MENRKTKWLIYTVLVGLIPIISRLIVWFATKEGTISLMFSPSDFIAFGLVLHISNINEIEHFDIEKNWKTAHNGISISFIALYSVLFTLTLMGNAIVDIQAITYGTIALAIVSFLISYSVYDRVSKESLLIGGNND